VRFVTEIGTDGDGWLLAVHAENLTGRAIELELPERCPAGALDFEGLPDPYDYYSSCVMGDCSEAPPLRIALEPGGRAEVTTTLLRPGQGPCQPELAPGRYEIQPVLPALPLATCVAPAPLEIAAASAAGGCASDADCVIHCPQASGCCSSAPCGCRTARLRTEVAAADAEYAQTCERAPDCPAMGCAYDEAYFVRCDQGRCVTVDGP
jgi:hypothetical protein